MMTLFSIPGGFEGCIAERDPGAGIVRVTTVVAGRVDARGIAFGILWQADRAHLR